MIELSEIGLIINKPGTYNGDGEQVKAPTYVPGWHVNATASIPEFKPYEIEVKTPTRIYAGGDTVFLRFDSEAHFDEVIKTLEPVPEPANQ